MNPTLSTKMASGDEIWVFDEIGRNTEKNAPLRIYSVKINYHQEFYLSDFNA
jgi:hypothetical protein